MFNFFAARGRANYQWPGRFAHRGIALRPSDRRWRAAGVLAAAAAARTSTSSATSGIRLTPSGRNFSHFKPPRP